MAEDDKMRGNHATRGRAVQMTPAVAAQVAKVGCAGLGACPSNPCSDLEVSHPAGREGTDLLGGNAPARDDVSRLSLPAPGRPHDDVRPALHEVPASARTLHPGCNISGSDPPGCCVQFDSI